MRFNYRVNMFVWSTDIYITLNANPVSAAQCSTDLMPFVLGIISKWATGAARGIGLRTGQITKQFLLQYYCSPYGQTAA